MEDSVNLIFQPLDVRLQKPLTYQELKRINQIQIWRGPVRLPNDPERDIETALKGLGPKAQEQDTVEGLTKKIQKHIELNIGDWTATPDCDTIGKGLLNLLQTAHK